MVLERVREQLAERRAAGAPFPLAWRSALAAGLRSANDDGDRAVWRTVLDETRRAWEAAYDGAAASRADRAAGLIGYDREPTADGHAAGACEHCRQSIPPGKPRHARYCSTRCQKGAWHKRTAAAA